MSNSMLALDSEGRTVEIDKDVWLAARLGVEYNATGKAAAARAGITDEDDLYRRLGTFRTDGAPGWFLDFAEKNPEGAIALVQERIQAPVPPGWLRADVMYDQEARQRSQEIDSQESASMEDETPEEAEERQGIQSETWAAMKEWSAARKAREEGGGERKPRPSDDWQLSVPTGDAEAMYWEKIMGWAARTAEGMREYRAELEAETEQAEYEEDQRLMKTPGHVPETRGEALDRQLGPVPAELMSKVSDEPLTRGKGTPAWDTTPVVGEKDQRIVPVDIPGATGGSLRLPKETPSQKAARVALLKEQEDTD